MGGISSSIRQVFSPDGCFIQVNLDLDAIQALQLEVDIESIALALVAAPKLKIKPKHIVTRGDSVLRISPPDDSHLSGSLLSSLAKLSSALPDVIVKGHSSVTRAVINHDDGDEGGYHLLVEGLGLANVLGTTGVDWKNTTSNHIMEVARVLGIEAARHAIAQQINFTMAGHGLSVDHRHLMLLADLMTFKGVVLGITRFGIAKMKESVLMLASFEKTVDHLLEAAVRGQSDPCSGVSECIIIGKPMPCGTGLFQCLAASPGQEALSLEKHKRKPLLFGNRLRVNSHGRTQEHQPAVSIDREH